MALAHARLGDTSAIVKGERVAEVERALESLTDPIQRLKYGVEWPSLGEEGARILREHQRFAEVASDPKLDCDSAVETLIARESSYDQSHARAVFRFLRASALFQWRSEMRNLSALADGSAINIAMQLLTEGLDQWARATSAREFWLERRLDAKAFGDPRVDAAMLKQLEADTVSLPLTRFARAASVAVQARDGGACCEIVRVLRSCRCPASYIEEALSSIYVPMCARAPIAIDKLSSDLKALESQRACDFSALLKRYEHEVGHDMQVIFEIGDLLGSAEERLRDQASAFLYLLAVNAHNEAKAFEVSLPALEIAHQAVNSPNIRAEIASVQVTIRAWLA